MSTFQKFLLVSGIIFLLPLAIFSQSWVQHSSNLLPGKVTVLYSNITSIFAGTQGEGLYYSSNNGTSWNNIKSNLPNATVKAVFVNDTDIFLGMNYYGVMKSTNMGGSWASFNAGLLNRYVQAFSNLGTYLFVGTKRGGVFRSTNNAASWVSTSDGLPNNADIRTLTTRGTMIFAGTETGVYISVDSGASWSASNSGLTNTDVSGLLSRSGTVFACTNGGGVFSSTNGGRDWVASNSGLTNYNVTSLVASGTNLFAGTFGGGIFQSTNDGAAWTPANSGVSNLYINTLLALGTNVFAGTNYGSGGGILISTNNGASWSGTNSGLLQYGRINAFSISGSNLFAVSEGGVSVSTNSGSTWSPVSNGISTNTVANAIAVSGNNLFVGTEGNGVLVSTNNGAAWATLNNGFHSTPKIRTILVNGANIYAASDSGCYISTNNGGNWGPSNSGLVNKDIVSMSFVDTVLFAGTNTGLYSSFNKGLTWVSSSTGLPSIQVNSITNIAQDIFIATEGSGIFKSNNQGSSWQAVNNGLAELFVRQVYSHGTMLFAATWYGVYVSVNQGSEWVPIFNTGLTNTNIQSLFVANIDLLAGTNGGGIFKLDFSAVLLTGALQKSSYCTTNQFSVPVLAVGTFNTGNIFTAELSDSNGTFSNPMDIGTLNSTTSGNLTATIPTIASPGTKYRIRLRSSSPNLTSPDNGKDFTIHILPNVGLIGFDSVCASAPPFILTGGSPSGGTYTGLGVSNGKFYPGQVGPGTHSIAYTFTDPNGCTNSATKPIKVMTLPDVSMDSLRPVCVYASSFDLNGGLPPGGIYTGPGVSNGRFNPSSAGAGKHLVKYTVIGENGCSNTDSAFIVVNPKPNVLLTNFKDICLDTPAFDVTGGLPAGGVYSGNGIINGKFFPALAGTGNHAIKYYYKDANGCDDSATRFIHVYPMPPRPGISRGGDELAASAASRYQWYFKDVEIVGADKQYYTPDKVGFYTVRIWDVFGCSSISDPFYYEGTGVNDVVVFSDGIVYPNPTDGKLSIKFNKGFNSAYDLSVKDLLGNTLFTYSGVAGNGLVETADISNLPTGIYFMQMFYSERNHIIKIIKK